MRTTKPAFTLVELLLGAVVTSLIGLSVVTVGGALTSRYDKSETYYQSVQAARSSLSKVQAQFHAAQLVTQVSPSQITLWGDAGGDGQINPGELVVLTYSGGTIRQYHVVYPGGLSEALKAVLDAPISLSTAVEQPNTLASQLASALYGTSKVLASDVTAFSVSADVPPPMTRIVTLSVTTGTGPDAVTVRSVAALRGDKTGSVAWVNGHYALAGS